MTSVFKDMAHSPYWWDAAPRPVSEEVDLPRRVDVAIVGAGFSGLHAALVQARAGKSVMLFEAGPLGYGASTRNGGMVGPSFHKLGVLGMKQAYGEERANAILRQSLGFVEFLDSFLKEEGIECQFRRNGRFRGALRPEHFDTMARQLETLRAACGVEGHMVAKADQREEIGSDLFHGGIVYNSDGGLHPGLYFDGLVACARAAGVTIAAETPVTGVERVTGGFNISCPRGSVRAEQVAICTNGYTGDLTPQFRRRILPIRTAMIATEALPAEVMDRLFPKDRVTGDSRRIVAYYRRSPDGTRVLFGGRAASTADKPLVNAKLLRRQLVEVFPELESVKISHSWSGLVAYTFDHVPHLGEMDGLYYAMGYCGSGVARASFFGRKLGLKMLGSEEGATPFDDLPFNGRPLYNGTPWFMPAMLAWHRVADKLGL